MALRKRWWLKIAGAVIALLIVLLVATTALHLPESGAMVLLHPFKRPMTSPLPAFCEEKTFEGEGVKLKGWFAPAEGHRRGTVIYLHGIADNRASGAGVMERFRKRGFDVIAYDSRAHGQSDGEVCSYGVFEKQDLHRVLDTVAPGPIVLLGGSLGAAVALQEAAEDARVSTVVAVDCFSDLRTVATERAPFLFTRGTIEKAFKLVAQQGHFLVDTASPLEAARSIRVPVLLIHGAEDRDTKPDHSRRLLAALAGPKRLILVPGASHGKSLGEKGVWQEIDAWIDAALGGPPIDGP